jgi:hypothetical protein
VLCIRDSVGWAASMRRRIDAAGIAHVTDYRVVDESSYVNQIDDIDDSSLDLVVVDGLFRAETLIRSISKVQCGGWIVFDNANWYFPSSSRSPHSRSFADGPSSTAARQAWEIFSRWRSTWTSNGVNDTAIFRAPDPRHEVERQDSKWE